MRDPLEVVRRYLKACEERHLEEAQRYLAPGAVLVFPGGRYTSVAEMAAGAARRYRWAKKADDAWDVAVRPDGTAVVVTTGTLYGENLHGVPFEGVRYIDRFVVRGERILRQEVWNDLDASGVLHRRASEGRTGED
ncbi:MAG: nuclear transport factor 2 family protein [Armatimonadota bacterium]|nr:nuclear transport factor 2 family protein [Armatimonadota bacterium]MDR7452125.1 nuclear transport factor 2 family protein [Armatimonadota bacterium]MDR7467849.1 nuclear transport factor 2 family protein [Armatimonadota bacterium]MDR7494737.1 nuclear transport factor 2 family protein [Armatimonadota bacterium]MDR7499562.1 nuclear transport factor 2 family protein [Armatimonadota bacterium]